MTQDFGKRAQTRISLRASAVWLAVFLLCTLPAYSADVVAHYALDGNAEDSSGNGHHGTSIVDVEFVADAARGTVASFNGTSSSINVSASGYSITEAPNFQFAVSFWIKPTARDDYHPAGAIDLNVIMGSATGGRGVIEIVGQGSWQGMGGVPAYGGIGVNSGGGAGSVAAVDTIDVYDGEWHHVVVQWVDPDGTVAGGESADATIYIDNQLASDVNDQTYNGNGNATSNMVLGGPVVWSDGGPVDKYYGGLLSDVIFLDDQLTAQDVDDLFNGGLSQAPAFQITAIALNENDDVTIIWNSRPGNIYGVEASGDMVTWFELDDGVSTDETMASFTESFTKAAPMPDIRFYRAREFEQ